MKKSLFILSFVSMAIIANAQWQQTSLSYHSGINCLAISGNNIFVGTESSGVFLSSNNGNNWDTANTGLTGNALHVAAFATKGDTIFAGTEGSGVYSSTNNGNNWTSTASGITGAVHALAIKGDTIIAGTEATVGSGMFISPNNGSSWTAVNNGLPTFSIEVSAIAIKGSNIFTGIWGGIYLSSNYGQHWSVSDTTGFAKAGVYAFAISGSNIFAGTDNGVYITINNGSNWTKVNNGLSDTNVDALAISGSNIFAGTGNGVYMSSNNGSSWTEVNNGFPPSPTITVITALAINGNNIFAATGGYGVWERPLSQMTGIEINNNAGNIEVYPNPANDKLTIESLQKSTIEMLNIQGQTILQQTAQQGKTVIDISGLAKGVYIVRLCSNDKTEVARIVKE